MKYAFMTFSTPELTLTECLDAASRFGYDAIEPRIQAGHAHGIELGMGGTARREARQRAEDAGVRLCCIATSCRYADPALRASMLDDSRRAVDLAGDVGAPCVRVFGGAIGAGLNRRDAVEAVAECLRELAPRAAERNVTLCMETHDDWCDPRYVAEVMRRVDHPNVAVNWDLMHPVRTAGRSMADAYATLSPWVRHVHFHDGTVRDPLTMLPIGKGCIDHRTPVRLLREAGYEGCLSGEWINWEPWEEHLPRELAAIKALEAE